MATREGDLIRLACGQPPSPKGKALENPTAMSGHFLRCGGNAGRAAHRRPYEENGFFRLACGQPPSPESPRTLAMLCRSRVSGPHSQCAGPSAPFGGAGKGF